MAGARSIQQWKTWQIITSVDTEVDMKPSSKPAMTDLRMVSVHPYNMLMIRVFIIGNDDNKIRLRFVGWMKGDSSATNGNHCGPGMVLWNGDVSAGTVEIANVRLLPTTRRGDWGAAVTWRDTDTFATVEDVVGIPTPPTDTTAQQGFIVLPTVGFSDIACEITSITETGTPSSVGVMYREIASGDISNTRGWS